MTHLILLVLVPVMSILHRLRGGGFVTLPVKGTYVLWPLVGVLAWLTGAPWPVALAWAVGYLLWVLPAWTVFLTRAVGAAIPADQYPGSGFDVKIVNALSFGNAVLACFVRAALFLIPLAVALLCLDIFDGIGSLYDGAPLLLIVAAFLPAYVVGYRVRSNDMSSVAEPIVGAVWGAAMAASIFLMTL